MKLKLLLLYSIHATYRRIQMTELLACPPCITPSVLFLQTAIWNPRAGLTLRGNLNEGHLTFTALEGRNNQSGDRSEGECHEKSRGRRLGPKDLFRRLPRKINIEDVTSRGGGGGQSSLILSDVQRGKGCPQW